MEKFNTVPNKGTFGGSVEVINQNFLLAQQEMETLRQTYNSLSQSKIIPVTQLPATGEAGKIYRLAGTTSYADYMYKESDLTTPIKMAEYDNAIDDEPTDGSDNLVRSSGVKKAISKFVTNMESSSFIFTLSDNLNHLLLGLKGDKTIDIPLYNIYSTNEEVESKYDLIIIDKYNHIIAAKERNGGFKAMSSDIPSTMNIYDRNKNTLEIPYSIGNDYNSPQLLIVADSHFNPGILSETSIVARALPKCKAIVHLGDIVTDEGGIFEDIKSYVEMLPFDIPAYVAVGNHDCGHTTGRVLIGVNTKRYLYNIIVKPLINRGYLKEGEYVEDNCYYYHDFIDDKVRLIILNQWDSNEVLQNSDYWTPVTYNPAYEKVSKRNYGINEYINIPNYDKYSFVCKSAVNVTFASGENKTLPCLKDNKFQCWYSEEQLIWLCNTLKGAAELGYTCVIASHQIVYANHISDVNSAFSDGKYGADMYRNRFTNDTVNIISDIVNAYHTKTSILKVMEPQYVENLQYPDDVSSIPSFTLSYDFSNIDIPSAVFFIHGHDHRDAVHRNSKYEGQVSISFNKAYGLDDQDQLTILSVVDKQTLHLCRINSVNSYRIVGEEVKSKTNVIIKN